MDQVTTYVAGPGVLLGAERVWLLLDRSPGADLLASWYALVRGGSGADALVAAVERHHRSSAASFVLVDVTPGRERTVAGGRGGFGGDGTLDVGLEGGGLALPLVSGVVAASSAQVVRPAAAATPAIIDGIPPEILAGRVTAPPAAPTPVPPTAAPPTTAPPTTAPPTASPMAEPPSVSRTVARHAARPGPPALDPDHDGHTTLRPEVGHLRQATHETVLAAVCLQGHPTPPHAPSCRICGAPVPPQEPQRVPRPPLGRLVLPTGECVALDRGVVFGRKPAPLPGGEAWPHLVHLPADSTNLSRSHLQVELDGWLVIARDLGSSSGTTLRVPGRPAERIRANEPHVLEPGHWLDLADVYEIVYEVTP